MRGAVARYAIAGLVALAVVAVAGALVLDRVSEDEAVEEAGRLATLAFAHARIDRWDEALPWVLQKLRGESPA